MVKTQFSRRGNKETSRRTIEQANNRAIEQSRNDFRDGVSDYMNGTDGTDWAKASWLSEGGVDAIANYSMLIVGFNDCKFAY